MATGRRSFAGVQGALIVATKSNDTDRKPQWRNPSVQEIGNLRDFVRTGNAFGKSFATTDGNAHAGNESMP